MGRAPKWGFHRGTYRKRASSKSSASCCWKPRPHCTTAQRRRMGVCFLPFFCFGFLAAWQANWLIPSLKYVRKICGSVRLNIVCQTVYPSLKWDFFKARWKQRPTIWMQQTAEMLHFYYYNYCFCQHTWQSDFHLRGPVCGKRVFWGMDRDNEPKTKTVDTKPQLNPTPLIEYLSI